VKKRRRDHSAKTTDSWKAEDGRRDGALFADAPPAGVPTKVTIFPMDEKKILEERTHSGR